MEIKNFPGMTITLGEWPACLRVEPLGHDCRGVLARFYIGDEQERVEIRHRDREYALIIFRFSDMALPTGWEESELVWSLRKEIDER